MAKLFSWLKFGRKKGESAATADPASADKNAAAKKAAKK